LLLNGRIAFGTAAELDETFDALQGRLKVEPEIYQSGYFVDLDHRYYTRMAR
jgi:hypothetical protein